MLLKITFCTDLHRISRYWNPQSAEFIILTIRFGTMVNSDSWRGNPKRTLWTRVCWLDDRGRNKSKTCGCIGKCFIQTGDSQIRYRPSHCKSVILYVTRNRINTQVPLGYVWKYSKTPVNTGSAIIANWVHWKRKLKLRCARLSLSPGSGSWFTVVLELQNIQSMVFLSVCICTVVYCYLQDQLLNFACPQNYIRYEYYFKCRILEVTIKRKKKWNIKYYTACIILMASSCNATNNVING